MHGLPLSTRLTVASLTPTYLATSANLRVTLVTVISGGLGGCEAAVRRPDPGRPSFEREALRGVLRGLPLIHIDTPAGPIGRCHIAVRRDRRTWEHRLGRLA